MRMATANRAGGPCRVLQFVLTLLLVLPLAGCGDDPPETRTSITPGLGPGHEPRPPVPIVPFVDVTQASGIGFVHTTGNDGDVLFPELMGSGCALFDYDGDGDLDIFFVNGCDWPWTSGPPEAEPPTQALYRNGGNMTFQDVTAEAGLDVTFYGLGAAASDFDNDGDSDLFVTAVGKNHLFRNDGGRFRDITDVAGVGGDPKEFSTCCGWFDFDNDGDLDLFVGNYIVWSWQLNLTRSFRTESGVNPVLTPQAFRGTFPYLYRNDGDGLFSDVSRESGVQVVNPDTGEPVAKALGLCFVDLNADDWLDILLANDTVRNFAYVNGQDGTFREVGEKIGVAVGPRGTARQGMGIDVADFRGDGSRGVAIGNFATEMTALFVSAPCRQRPIPLQRLTFSDEAMSAGIGAETRVPLTFGLFFFDYDLDGRLDFFQTNGHVNPAVEKTEEGHTYAQPAQLFWNCGQAGPADYVAVTPEESGADLFRPIVGRGAAYGDLDGDGDLDVVLTANGGPPVVLRNDQKLGHHYLRLKLVGEQSNRDAIGGVVEVRVGKRTLRRQVMPTRSYLSHCEKVVTFGLERATSVDEIRIVWPGGAEQVLTEAPVDQLVRVREGKAL